MDLDTADNKTGSFASGDALTSMVFLSPGAVHIRIWASLLDGGLNHKRQRPHRT